MKTKKVIRICVWFIAITTIVCLPLILTLNQGVIKRKLDTERIASTPPDKRSGDFCPMCKSKDVSRFIYGLRAANDSATLDDERKQKIIRGGCVLSSKSPKYICNSCSYEWGNVFQSKK